MDALRVNDVSIRFITGDLRDVGLKEVLIKRLTGKYRVQEFWADHHITFSLQRGDMLGIIGTNGAGKSTLLKAVSGVLEPTEGSIKVRGRIAALLELSSGFDSQMTVRENTYLRGALLGYTRAFMNEKYSEIIDFAELQEFQDYPFRNLSSGMKSRLAFSIACLVDPDLIILDEVLSVGDGRFRKKSGDKMRQILDSGVTGILVSHSVSQVRELCNKILWLDHGQQITFSEDVQMCCDAYEEFLVSRKLPHTANEITALADAFSNRTEKQKEEQDLKEAKHIRRTLANSGSMYLKDAVKLIQREKPGLLKEKKKKNTPPPEE